MIFARHAISPRIAVETACSATGSALVIAGPGCGIVDPVTGSGDTGRGLLLKRPEPSVDFRPLLLLPPRKPSHPVRDMATAFRAERAAQGVRQDTA